MTANEDTAVIDQREDQDIRAYVRALEERVMKLEARLARAESLKDQHELRDAGYLPVAPSESAADSDRAACANATCEHCAHVGLRYEPWSRSASTGMRSSYRAFAVCPACGSREEF